MISPAGLTFCVRDIPFSYAGSWFGISPVVAEKTSPAPASAIAPTPGPRAPT